MSTRNGGKNQQEAIKAMDSRNRSAHNKRTRESSLVSKSSAAAEGEDQQEQTLQPKSKQRKTEEPSLPLDDTTPVTINRAPVLILWVTVCAEHGPLRLSHENALTLGQAIAGIISHKKGVSIGLYQEKELSQEEKEERKKRHGEHERVNIMGFHLPVRKQSNGGVVALTGDKQIDWKVPSNYLHNAYKQHFQRVTHHMKELVEAVMLRPDGAELIDSKYSFHLYEQFRPGIPFGQQGWGKKGEFNLAIIRELIEEEKKKGAEHSKYNAQQNQHHQKEHTTSKNTDTSKEEDAEEEDWTQLKEYEKEE